MGPGPRRRLRRRVAVLATAVAVLCVLGGCGLGPADDSDGAVDSGRITQVAEADREAPLEIAGTALDGTPLDIADLRGKPVVLNVWWSLCGPCREEMPLLNQVAAMGDAAFVGINIREASLANATAFERDRGVSYPSLYDPGSELLLRFGRYPPVALPTTVVLDEEGRVAAVIPGAVPSARTLIGVIEDATASSGRG